MAVVPQQRLTRHPGLTSATMFFADETRMTNCVLIVRSSRPGPSSVERGKGANEAPSRAVSPFLRNHGIAWSRRGSPPTCMATEFP